MTIAIVAYDPAWPDAFEAERNRLQTALGALAVRIDHHGSTAVPGLAAKPIIDIQISVERLQPIGAYAAPLERLGYVHVAHPDDDRCPFFHRPADWPHTHHVHLVEAGGEEERRTLAFRDYLRDHAGTAGEYQRLKQAIAAHVVGDDADAREEYARCKTEFVEQVVALAFRDGYPTAVVD